MSNICQYVVYVIVTFIFVETASGNSCRLCTGVRCENDADSCLMVNVDCKGKQCCNKIPACKPFGSRIFYCPSCRNVKCNTPTDNCRSIQSRCTRKPCCEIIPACRAEKSSKFYCLSCDNMKCPATETCRMRDNRCDGQGCCKQIPVCEPMVNVPCQTCRDIQCANPLFKCELIKSKCKQPCCDLVPGCSE